MYTDLKKLRTALIHFRQNSVGNKTPHALATDLRLADGRVLPEDTNFFEFFADALFFTKSDGTDRAGAFHAFAGFEDILSALLDVTNSSLQFKDDLLASLERFENALEIYESVDSSNAFRSKPEKQNNLITYYLHQTRRELLPTKALLKIAAQVDARQISRADLKAVQNYYRVHGFKFSDPVMVELINLIDEIKKESAGTEKAEQINLLANIVVQRLEERWRRICLVGYRGTRIGAEAKAPTAEKLISRSNKIAWAVSCALRYVPADGLETEDLWLALPRGIVGDTLRLCYRSGNYNWKTADQIGRLAWFVMQGEEYYWRKKWRKKRRASTDKPPKEDAASSSPADEVATVDAWTDEIFVQREEGGDPDELVENSETPVKEFSPEGTSAESKAFRVTFDEASWGRARLTSETLGVVWSWLIGQTQSAPDDARLSASLLFIELLIRFGFSPELLLAAQIANSSTDNSANIVFGKNEISISPVRPGHKPAFAAPLPEEMKDHYLPGAQQFCLPLSAYLAGRLEKFRLPAGMEGKVVFHNLLGGKSVADGKKILNKILKPLEALIGEKITVGKIAKSPRTLFAENAALGALEIAVLSGEIPRRTASPMFYTNYRAEELVHRFDAAAVCVIRCIVKSSAPYIAHLNLPPLAETWTDFKISNAPERKSPDKRFGSPFVPHADKFSDYLNGLRREAGQTKDFVLAHNRRTAYAALVLMTLTGMRPLELSYLAHRHLVLDAGSAVLAVTAKINQKYAEWRTLRLSPAATQVLREYNSLAAEMRRDARLQTALTLSEINLRLEDNLFFFLRRTRVPLKITTRGLADLLRESSYLEYRHFPWKLNAPRHFYRTTAAELRVPDRVINSLLGHQTTGYESLGLFSADDRAEETHYAQAISARIVDLLKLSYGE